MFDDQNNQPQDKPVEESTTTEEVKVDEVVENPVEEPIKVSEVVEAEVIAEEQPDEKQNTSTSEENTTIETTVDETVREDGMYTVRSQETGDKVYLVRENKRYWIKNPETLAKLGFYLGKEKKLPFSELLALSEGEPIDLTIPGAVEPWNRPEGETPVNNDSSGVWN